MKIELNDDGVETLCNWINNIIEAAIIYGGEDGYSDDKKELERRIRVLINWLSIKEKVIIYRDDFPKILLRKKLEEER